MKCAEATGFADYKLFALKAFRKYDYSSEILDTTPTAGWSRCQTSILYVYLVLTRMIQPRHIPRSIYRCMCIPYIGFAIPQSVLIHRVHQ